MSIQLSESAPIVATVGAEPTRRYAKGTGIGARWVVAGVFGVAHGNAGAAMVAHGGCSEPAGSRVGPTGGV